MSNKKNNTLKLTPIILIAFCMFLYTPILKHAPVISYAIQYGIPIAFILTNIKCIKTLPLKTLILLAACGLMFTMSLIIPVLFNTNDFSYLANTTYVFRKAPIYLFLIIIIIRKYGRNSIVEHFLYHYSMATVVYILFTIILIATPQIKTIWFNIFSMTNGTEELLTNYGYTFRIGWLGFSGFRFTMYCTFSCIFLLYLRYSSGKYLTAKQFIIPYLICILGNMFYGRVGIIATFATSVLMMVMTDKLKIKNILILSLVAAALLFSLYTLRNLPIISDWYNWMTTPIVNLFTKGDFDNYSFDRMNSMLFMPEPETLIHGDGYYVYEGHYYKKTDLGIMRNVLYWGIPGAILSYGTTLYGLMDAKRKSRALLIAIIIAFAIFEYKGDTYYEIIAFIAPMTAFLNIKHNMLETQYD